MRHLSVFIVFLFAAVGLASASGPSGYFDGTNVTTGSPGTSIAMWGWAQENGAPLPRVDILLDGTVVGSATMNVARPDLGNNDGWTFTYTLPATITNGTHRFSAIGYDSAGASATLIYSTASAGEFTVTGGVSSGSGTISGNFDAISPSSATPGTKVNTWGWAAENSAPVASVDVLMDGAKIGNATMGIHRNDFNNNTGWAYSFTVTTAIANGTHTFTAVAHDSAGSSTTLPGSKTLAVSGSSTGGGGGTTSSISGSMDAVSPTSVTPGQKLNSWGWAAENNAAVASVDILLDGTKIGNATMNVHRNDFNNNTGWTFTYIVPNTVANGTHTLSALAHDAAGNSNTLRNPRAFSVSGSTGGGGGGTTGGSITGSIDAVSPTSATPGTSLNSWGWASENNAPVASVDVLLDGAFVGSAQMNIHRNDFNNNTGWQFFYTVPGTLTNGTHTFTAVAHDSAGNSTTLHNARTFTMSGSTAGGGGSSSGAVAVYTYGYSNARTMANTNETVLTPAIVTNGSNFGKLGSWTLDGSVYTQPLYVPNITINGALHNALYVATENDSVYALDADHPGTVLWKHSFLVNGATVGTAYTGGRTSVGGNVGVTGTPVIDPNTNRLYVVARTTESGSNVQRIHALDIRNGSEALTPQVIQATVSGTGMGSSGGQLAFDQFTHNQRQGLALANGVVYVAFASWGDYIPYHGWLFAYDAGTLNQLGVYVSTPNGGGGGFWAGGGAPAVDSSGNVYVATGNGMPNATAPFDPPNDLPNTLLKLRVQNGGLQLVDYFAPYNTVCLSADDLDLGSTAPALLPDLNMIALGSKEGRAYLVNQASLGHFNSGGDSQIPDSQLFNPQGACGSSTFNASTPWRVYGAPAYWNGNLYFGSAFGPLRHYDVSGGKLVQKELGTHTYAASGQLGRAPLVTLSANGTSNAIVWTIENDLNGNGWLRAYDATNIANQLYSVQYGTGANFLVPMVANGHVYFSGKNVVYSYGKLR